MKHMTVDQSAIYRGLSRMSARLTESDEIGMCTKFPLYRKPTVIIHNLQLGRIAVNANLIAQMFSGGAFIWKCMPAACIYSCANVHKVEHLVYNSTTGMRPQEAVQ